MMKTKIRLLILLLIISTGIGICMSMFAEGAAIATGDGGNQTDKTSYLTGLSIIQAYDQKELIANFDPSTHSYIINLSPDKTMLDQNGLLKLWWNVTLLSDMGLSVTIDGADNQYNNYNSGTIYINPSNHVRIEFKVPGYGGNAIFYTVYIHGTNGSDSQTNGQPYLETLSIKQYTDFGKKEMITDFNPETYFYTLNLLSDETYSNYIDLPWEVTVPSGMNLFMRVEYDGIVHEYTSSDRIGLLSVPLDTQAKIEFKITKGEKFVFYVIYINVAKEAPPHLINLSIKQPTNSGEKEMITNFDPNTYSYTVNLSGASKGTLVMLPWEAKVPDNMSLSVTAWDGGIAYTDSDHQGVFSIWLDKPTILRFTVTNGKGRPETYTIHIPVPDGGSNGGSDDKPTIEPPRLTNLSIKQGFKEMITNFNPETYSYTINPLSATQDSIIFNWEATLPSDVILMGTADTKFHIYYKFGYIKIKNGNKADIEFKVFNSYGGDTISYKIHISDIISGGGGETPFLNTLSVKFKNLELINNFNKETYSYSADTQESITSLPDDEQIYVYWDAYILNGLTLKVNGTPMSRKKNQHYEGWLPLYLNSMVTHKFTISNNNGESVTYDVNISNHLLANVMNEDMIELLAANLSVLGNNGEQWKIDPTKYTGKDSTGIIYGDWNYINTEHTQERIIYLTVPDCKTDLIEIFAEVPSGLLLTKPNGKQKLLRGPNEFIVSVQSEYRRVSCKIIINRAPLVSLEANYGTPEQPAGWSSAVLEHYRSFAQQKENPDTVIYTVPANTNHIDISAKIPIDASVSGNALGSHVFDTDKKNFQITAQRGEEVEKYVVTVLKDKARLTYLNVSGVDGISFFPEFDPDQTTYMCVVPATGKITDIRKLTIKAGFGKGVEVEGFRIGKILQNEFGDMALPVMDTISIWAEENGSGTSTEKTFTIANKHGNNIFDFLDNNSVPSWMDSAHKNMKWSQTTDGYYYIRVKDKNAYRVYKLIVMQNIGIYDQSSVYTGHPIHTSGVLNPINGTLLDFTQWPLFNGSQGTSAAGDPKNYVCHNNPWSEYSYQYLTAGAIADMVMLQLPSPDTTGGDTMPLGWRDILIGLGLIALGIVALILIPSLGQANALWIFTVAGKILAGALIATGILVTVLVGIATNAEPHMNSFCLDKYQINNRQIHINNQTEALKYADYGFGDNNTIYINCSNDVELKMRGVNNRVVLQNDNAQQLTLVRPTCSPENITISEKSKRIYKFLKERGKLEKIQPNVDIDNKGSNKTIIIKDQEQSSINITGNNNNIYSNKIINANVYGKNNIIKSDVANNMIQFHSPLGANIGNDNQLNVSNSKITIDEVTQSPNSGGIPQIIDQKVKISGINRANTFTIRTDKVKIQDKTSPNIDKPNIYNVSVENTRETSVSFHNIHHDKVNIFGTNTHIELNDALKDTINLLGYANGESLNKVLTDYSNKSLKRTVNLNGNSHDNFIRGIGYDANHSPSGQYKWNLESNINSSNANKISICNWDSVWIKNHNVPYNIYRESGTYNLILNVTPPNP